MKDEIKEILDYMKEESNYKHLSFNASKQLLDYITNLQQENEKLLQENIVIKGVKYLVEDSIYKSRCERAIGYIKSDWYKLNTRDIEHVVNLGKDIRIDLLNILQNGGDDKWNI